MPKCPNTFILCTTDAHKKYYSIKIGSFSFFSSSGKHQSHHLNGFYVTFFKFTMPRQKPDMNDSSRVIFIIISIINLIILLRSTLRIPISLQENMTLPEPSLK